MSAPLVLASTSPYRRELLDRLGLAYDAVPHKADERALQAAWPALAPDELVVSLAVAKAESIAGDHPNRIVIGCDQLVDLDGEILLKPGTAERARETLAMLRGRDHRLLTALAVLPPSAGDVARRAQTHLDVHAMRLRADLTDAEIAVYVERDNPLDCAGAIKVESLGIALLDRIDGADYTAIIGLPLIALTGILRDLGVPVLTP